MPQQHGPDARLHAGTTAGPSRHPAGRRSRACFCSSVSDRCLLWPLPSSFQGLPDLGPVGVVLHGGRGQPRCRRGRCRPCVHPGAGAPACRSRWSDSPCRTAPGRGGRSTSPAASRRKRSARACSYMTTRNRAVQRTIMASAHQEAAAENFSRHALLAPHLIAHAPDRLNAAVRQSRAWCAGSARGRPACGSPGSNSWPHTPSMMALAGQNHALVLQQQAEQLKLLVRQGDFLARPP